MTTQRTHTVKVTAAGSSVELGELRWLVKQLEGGADTLKVRVEEHRAQDQRESGSVTLTADVPETAVKKPVYR